jgi:hypothetical protein
MAVGVLAKIRNEKLMNKSLDYHQHEKLLDTRMCDKLQYRQVV